MSRFIKNIFRSNTPQCQGGVEDHQAHDGHTVCDPVNWSRIHKLLESCTPEHHKNCYTPVTKQLPPDFRVLDIEERRLVKPPVGSSHVALSYVWGALAHAGIETRMADLQSLEQHVPLDVLPRTLRDAITVCRRLEQRYLWIDRLCIVQDDVRSKPAQIAAMGTIYATATFVIIAVASDSADSPLPGVSCCRLKPLLGNSLSFPQIKSTVWWTRGWTYQEAVLARRRLCFEENQVWVECDTVVHREKTRDARSRRLSETRDFFFRNMGLRKTTNGVVDPDINLYDEHVEEYNSRQLTHTSDIFDAFAGVLGGLFDGKGGCHYGLPRAHFDEALLWTTEGNQVVSNRHVPDMPLPTWSWVSVTNKVTTHTSRNNFIGPLTVWFEARKNEDGSLTGEFEPIAAKSAPLWWARWEKTLWNSEQDIDDGTKSLHLILFLAIREGLFKPSKYLLPTEAEAREFKNDFRAIWNMMSRRSPQYYNYFYRELLASREAPRFLPDRMLRADVIVTEAHIAQFVIDPSRRVIELGRSAIKGIGILDQTGCAVGIISSENSLWAPSPHSTFDFVGLSLAIAHDSDQVFLPKDAPSYDSHQAFLPKHAPSYDSKEYRLMQNDEKLNINYFDENDVPLYSTPIVYVMMIDSNVLVSRRLGIGWIYMTRWVSANRQLRTIILE